jgi:hypothetical protein
MQVGFLFSQFASGRLSGGCHVLWALAAGGRAVGRRGQNGGDLFAAVPSKAPSYPKSKTRNLPRFWQSFSARTCVT